MIKSNPLEIKIKKRKIYFKYKSDRRKRTNKRHRRSGNRKVTNQYFKMSKPDKRQFYSNKYLYLFREIKKSLSNLKGNLKIAQNLEGQQNFDLTKEFFLNFKGGIYFMRGQPSKADISFLTYSLEYSLFNPTACISTDEHISKLLGYINDFNRDSYPKSIYFNNSKGLVLYKLVIRGKKFEKKQRFLDTKEKRIEFENNKLTYYQENKENRENKKGRETKENKLELESVVNS